MADVLFRTYFSVCSEFFRTKRREVDAFHQKFKHYISRDESGYTSSPQKDINDTPPRTYTSQNAKNMADVNTVRTSPSLTSAKYMISPFAAAAASASNSLPGIGFSFLTPSLMPHPWLNTLQLMQLAQLRTSAYNTIQQQTVKQTSQAEPLDLSQNHSKRQKVHRENTLYNCRYKTLAPCFPLTISVY